MTDAPLPLPEPSQPVPWGARGTVGPVFAGQVQLQSVSYAVRGKDIVKDISLELPAGRIACLLGPSGCGKTTLLRLAAGVVRPTAGRILMDGDEVAGPRKFVPPEKRNIGLMFQDFALFPHMTALQNVAYGLYALAPDEARKVATQALARVGLAAVAERYPAMLSGGEQQRVALARAIVPRPQVILMDEPFSGLDQRLRDSVRAETLAVLRETRATCLLVTHDPHEALAFADHIFLMRAGRLVQQGAPEVLAEQPVDAAAARFFRSLNEFFGVVEAGKVATPLGLVDASRFKSGDRVVVLVAPSAIGIVQNGAGLEALVLESRYMGEQRHVKFSIASSEQPVEIIVPADHIVVPGTTCNLALVGARPQVFRAGD